MQLECARFLLEKRGAEVNQKDVSKGWTPLHRCARMAHYTNAPYLELFEYLLSKGADGSLMTDVGFPLHTRVRCQLSRGITVVGNSLPMTSLPAQDQP